MRFCKRGLLVLLLRTLARRSWQVRKFLLDIPSIDGDNVDSSSKVGIPGAEKHKPYRSEEILNVNTLHISRNLTQ